MKRNETDDRQALNQPENDSFKKHKKEIDGHFDDEFGQNVKQLLEQDDDSLFLSNFQTLDKILTTFYYGSWYFSEKINILHFLANFGYDELLDKMLNQLPSLKYDSGRNILDETSEGADLTCLHIAAANGHIKVADLLIKKGANIEATDYEGKTPLMIAAEVGNVQFIEFLLDNGANIEAQDDYEKTCLRLAIASEQCEDAEKKEVVKLLIEHGANVNATDKYDISALISAVYQKYYDIAKLLIESGANMDVRDEDDSTLIDISFYNHDHKMLKLLIENGAITDAKDRDGKTAIEKAFNYALEFDNYTDKFIECTKELLKTFKPGALPDYSQIETKLNEEIEQNRQSEQAPQAKLIEKKEGISKVKEFFEIYKSVIYLIDNKETAAIIKDDNIVTMLNTIKTQEGKEFTQELFQSYFKSASLSLTDRNIYDFIQNHKIDPVRGDNANESMQSALESLGAFFPEQRDPNHPEMKPLGQNIEIEHD
jgi:ankyrin repeat protein